MGLFDKSPKEIAKLVASGAWSASKAAGKLGLKAAWGTTKITVKTGGKTVSIVIPDSMKNAVGKLNPGTCASCHKQLIVGKQGVVDGDTVHKKCVSQISKKAAEKFESLYHEDGSNRKSLYDEQGRNKNTKMHYDCGCNLNNTFHNCSKLRGQRTDGNAAKGAKWRETHEKDDKGRWK